MVYNKIPIDWDFRETPCIVDIGSLWSTKHTVSFGPNLLNLYVKNSELYDVINYMFVFRQYTAKQFAESRQQYSDVKRKQVNFVSVDDTKYVVVD